MSGQSLLQGERLFVNSGLLPVESRRLLMQCTAAEWPTSRSDHVCLSESTRSSQSCRWGEFGSDQGFEAHKANGSEVGNSIQSAMTAQSLKRLEPRERCCTYAECTMGLGVRVAMGEAEESARVRRSSRGTTDDAAT